MIGVFVGWRMVPVAIVLSALSGLIIALPGVIQAMLRRAESPKIPFGVYLALGGAATFVIGERLVTWYVHLAPGK
jgi:prepilin signal peptidase PulO-like enzyme (type II secretory pathway)